MQSARKVMSYALGLVVGLLAVAPLLNYNIPLVVNSYGWLYLVVAMLLFGAYLFNTSFPLLLKILMGYLMFSCFISSVPYLSFNAMILVVVSSYAMLWFSTNDMKPVVDMVCAAFIVQLLFAGMQLFSGDTLMNFDRVEPVFLGSVMQYMRFGSLLAIMTPLLVFKSKLFIVPIITAMIISQSSSFALAVIAGIVVYVMFRNKKFRIWAPIVGVLAFFGYLVWDKGSLITELTIGRIPVWGDIIRSWVMDTSHSAKLPLQGPIDIKSILFGRGMDTFMPLFPIFKHDSNPFAQAHNCHLQLLWEIGIVGYGLLAAYIINLVRRVWRYPLLVSGMVCMLINMFFAFPTRMTQTMFMMIAFIGLCEGAARKLDTKGENYA